MYNLHVYIDMYISMNIIHTHTQTQTHTQTHTHTRETERYSVSSNVGLFVSATVCVRAGAYWPYVHVK